MASRISASAPAAVGLAQCAQVLGVAEVVQQQEALVQVLFEHARPVQPGTADQRADAHEGGDAVLGCRRVHDDEAAAVDARDPEVAARAGVGGGQVQRGAIEPVARRQVVEPAAEGARARGVGPGDRQGLGETVALAAPGRGGGHRGDRSRTEREEARRRSRGAVAIVRP
jgi:hypothetical protein